jgi:hypothetical protein
MSVCCVHACVRFFFQQARAVELNRLTRHYQWFALVVGGIARSHIFQFALPLWRAPWEMRLFRQPPLVIVFASFQPRSQSYIICIYVPRRVSHQLLSESKLERAGWLYYVHKGRVYEFACAHWCDTLDHSFWIADQRLHLNAIDWAFIFGNIILGVSRISKAISILHISNVPLCVGGFINSTEIFVWVSLWNIAFAQWPQHCLMLEIRK